MIEAVQFEVINQALRAIFLGMLPLLVLVSLGGLLASGLLAAMSIREPAACYSVRLLVLGLALYYFFPALSGSVMALAELAFK